MSVRTKYETFMTHMLSATYLSLLFLPFFGFPLSFDIAPGTLHIPLSAPLYPAIDIFKIPLADNLVSSSSSLCPSLNNSTGTKKYYDIIAIYGGYRNGLYNQPFQLLIPDLGNYFITPYLLNNPLLSQGWSSSNGGTRLILIEQTTFHLSLYDSEYGITEFISLGPANNTDLVYGIEFTPFFNSFAAITVNEIFYFLFSASVDVPLSFVKIDFSLLFHLPYATLRNHNMQAKDLVSWETIPYQGSPPPPTLNEFSFTYLSSINSLILYGGLINYIMPQSMYLLDFYLFSLDTNQWTIFPYHNESFPLPRSRNIVLGYQNYILVYGGWSGLDMSGDQRWVQDVWLLDINTWEWKQLSEDQIKGRPSAGDYQAVMDSCGNVFMIGGDNVTLSYFNIHDAILAGSQPSHWLQIEQIGYQEELPIAPPRSHHGIVVTSDDRLIVTGGGPATKWDSGDQEGYSDIWVHDLRTDHWTSLTSNVTVTNSELSVDKILNRISFAMVLLSDSDTGPIRALIYGGVSIHTWSWRNDMWLLTIPNDRNDYASYTLTELEVNRPVGTLDALAIVVNETMYVLGGLDVDGNCLADLWSFSMSEGWNQLADCPIGCLDADVFAYYDGFLYTNFLQYSDMGLLYRYSLTENQWSTTYFPPPYLRIVEGAAVAQFDHLVFILWGEVFPDVPQSAIGCYDLSTQTLQLVDSLLVGGIWPTPRTGIHFAVGCQKKTANSRCILFGGQLENEVAVNDIHVLTKDDIFVDPLGGHDLACLYGVGFCASLTNALGHYSTNYYGMNYGLVSYVVVFSGSTASPRMLANGLSSIPLSTSFSIEGVVPFILDCQDESCFVIHANDISTTITLSSFVILNGKASNTTQGNGGAINIFNATLILNNMTFFNNSAPFAGGSIYAVQSTILMTNTTFSSNSAGVAAGATYFYNCVYVQCIQCQFDYNTAHDYGGAIFIAASKANFSSCEFSENNVLSTDLLSTVSGIGGAISSVMAQLSFYGNTFLSNAAILGGAIISEGRDDKLEEIFNQSSSLLLVNNTFVKNRANNTGGAIYLSALRVYESSYNLFLENIADGQIVHNGYGGGAIYYKSKSTSRFQSESDMFWNNQAVQGGGGCIYWNPPSDIYPDIDPVSFYTSAPQISYSHLNLTNFSFSQMNDYLPSLSSYVVQNTAMYGEYLASPPIRLRYATNFSLNMTPEMLIESGNVLMIPPSLALMDIFGNIVIVSSQVVVQANASLFQNSTDNTPPTLSGSIVEINKGTATFTNLIVTAAPGNYVSIQFSAQLSMLQNIYFFNETLVYQIDHCPLGTYLSERHTCQSCPNGFFSFQKDSLNCTLCDSTVNCFQVDTNLTSNITKNGTVMLAKAGYWLYQYSDNQTQSLIAGTLPCPPQLCLDFSQCQKNRHPNATSNLVCGECDSGFHVWDNQCVECGGINGGLLFGLIIISFIYLAIIRTFSRISSNQFSTFSYFAQISSLLLNSITANINSSNTKALAWLSIFDLTPTAMGFSCLMRLDDYGYLLLNLLSPFVLWILFGIMMITHYFLFSFEYIGPILRKYDRERTTIREYKLDFWNSYIRAFLAVSLASYQQITTMVFMSLHSISVPDNVNGTIHRVLFAIPSIDIDSPAYNRLFILLIFLLVVIVCGFPLASFLFIRWNEHQLFQESFVVRYGGLYESFRFDRFTLYNQSFILLRRMALTAIFVFLSINQTLCTYLVSLFNLLILLWHIFLQPHQTPFDNGMETVVLAILTFISVTITSYGNNTAVILFLNIGVAFMMCFLLFYIIFAEGLDQVQSPLYSHNPPAHQPWKFLRKISQFPMFQNRERIQEAILTVPNSPSRTQVPIEGSPTGGGVVHLVQLTPLSRLPSLNLNKKREETKQQQQQEEGIVMISSDNPNPPSSDDDEDDDVRFHLDRNSPSSLTEKLTLPISISAQTLQQHTPSIVVNTEEHT